MANPEPAPLPNADPIPVVESAAAAVAYRDGAVQAGTALAADLSLGHGGSIVDAVSAVELAPGRYRLHALAATGPRDHIIVDAVGLTIQAGDASNWFEGQLRVTEPGKLVPVAFDLAVDTPGPVTVKADWRVGDSMLDRQTYRDLPEARRMYRAQRQNAINQLLLKGGPGSGTTAPGDDLFGDLLGDLAAELDETRLVLRALTDEALPDYRLLLTGLVLERMSPVSVLTVRTDQAAYEPGATGRVTTDLRNWGTSPVEVQVSWTVEDDSRPGEILVRHAETVMLAAGEQRAHVLAEPLLTAGIARLGRVRVEAGVGALRPDGTRTPFVMLPAPVATPAPEQPRKVFAHYMGCYPVGMGATRHHRLNAGRQMRHDHPSDDLSRRGGRFRNFPLLPWDPALTLEESADLEIRRAMRIGIDGFAVDAWAGDDGAKEVMDALLRVAEEKDYPFEITVCLDPACGAHPVHTVREVLERWGDSPKLARRNGKPLIFGYFSHAFAMGTLRNEIDERTPVAEREDAVYRLRTSELGWHLIGQTFRKAEEEVGQPIFYHYDLIYFFHPMNRELVLPGMLTDAAAAIARHVPALGSFGNYGFQGSVEDVARAVRAAGAEWGGTGGMHQKENLFPGGGEVFMPKGTEWLRNVWSSNRRDDATLVQLITWNDYTENTNIAPAYNTRYTIYDLTGYFIAWWRNGEPPAVERDRVYLTYAKYPKDASAWPFSIRMRSDRALEVLTILTAPATVRLPGRDIEYDAPAGLHVEQFPIVPGPVIAELIRDGAVALRLESPEPITDRPFREDNAMVCFSTEFERHWREDFGDEPPLLYSEYGDLDGDGLPNWFEMYWFNSDRFDPASVTDADPLQLEEPVPHPVTRWLDMSTATLVDAQADPNRDGRTHLESYRERVDPTLPAMPKPGGGR